MADIFDRHDARNRRPDPDNDPVTTLDALGAVWSPDFDAYASGDIPLDQVRCVLCTGSPCGCPEFGTPEYWALLDRRHGNGRTR